MSPLIPTELKNKALSCLGAWAGLENLAILASEETRSLLLQAVQDGMLVDKAVKCAIACLENHPQAKLSESGQWEQIRDSFFQSGLASTIEQFISLASTMLLQSGTLPSSQDRLKAYSNLVLSLGQHYSVLILRVLCHLII